MEDRPTPTMVLHHLPLAPSSASFDPVLHYFSSVNTPEPLSCGLLHKWRAKVYLFLFLQLPLYTSFCWGCLLCNARPVILTVVPGPAHSSVSRNLVRNANSQTSPQTCCLRNSRQGVQLSRGDFVCLSLKITRLSQPWHADIIECLVCSMSVALPFMFMLPPNCSPRKCLQTLPNVPSGAKLPPGRESLP